MVMSPGPGYFFQPQAKPSVCSVRYAKMQCVTEREPRQQRKLQEHK